MSSDFELFPGKDLSGLFKDIYDNQQTKKLRISELIYEVKNKIRHLNDWIVIGPLIKDLVDLSIKNDDSLVKLATIAQRIANSATKVEGEEGYLTDREKAQLLEEVEIHANKVADANDAKVDDIAFEVDEIKKRIDNVK